jgi:hypothetical protein
VGFLLSLRTIALHLGALCVLSKANAADKLAAALADYQREFEKRCLEIETNRAAEEAADRVQRAKLLVDRSGLGKALLTLMEQTKYWPSSSKRGDFMSWAGFPVEHVLAREEWRGEQYRSEKVTAVLFVYKGDRYGMVFTDKGSCIMPDGEGFHRGDVEFISDGKVVLGLDISISSDEFAWRYFGVNALDLGQWSKALVEIATHINAHEAQSRTKWHNEQLITEAKNIRL